MNYRFNKSMVGIFAKPDFDIYYLRENGTSCQGLMTGHGDSPALYQCYDTVANILEKVRDWMNEHRNEVIVLYFGEIK
jgi:hypothetical protein